MSNYNSLKATIDANIKQNGNQEITGQILNSVLNQMVTTLGAGYQFAGVATIATNPGSPDAKVFYIANGKGTYEKFGGINVTEDDVVVLYWDSSWHKVSTGIASQEKLSELQESLWTHKQGVAIDINENLSSYWYTLEEPIVCSVGDVLTIEFADVVCTSSTGTNVSVTLLLVSNDNNIHYLADSKIISGATSNKKLSFEIKEDGTLTKLRLYRSSVTIVKASFSIFKKEGCIDAIERRLDVTDEDMTVLKGSVVSLSNSIDAVNEKVSDVEVSVGKLDESLANETKRAKVAESANATNIITKFTDSMASINAEIQRAQSKESSILHNIEDEENRARVVEQSLMQSIEELQNGGLPLKDEVIQRFVNNWLNSHPEASTSVEDNSLTAKKFVIGSLGFVTPQMFYDSTQGNDWTTALQMAIDSGYDVVIPNGEYTILGGLKIHDKHGLSITGMGNVVLYKPSATFPSKSIIDLRNGSSNISVSNICFKSIHDKEGRAPYNHIRPNANGSADVRGYAEDGSVISYGVSSNVYGISIYGVHDIKLTELCFENMESDFWFNSIGSQCDNIMIDGWHSKGANMPIYGSGLNNLYVKNIDVTMGKYAGEGDHCVYIGASQYLTFDGGSFEFSQDDIQKTALANKCGAEVMLTFHSALQHSKYISIKNITSITTRRFIHMPNCINSVIERCKVIQALDSRDNLMVFGNQNAPDNDLNVIDSYFESPNGLAVFYFNNRSTIKCKNCNITSSSESDPVFVTSNLFVENCTIKGHDIIRVGGQADNPTSIYFKDTEFEQTKELEYLIRAASDYCTITFFNCILKGLNSNYILYPADESTSAEFFTLINTFVFGVKRIIWSNKDHGSVAINSYKDGTLIVANP